MIFDIVEEDNYEDNGYVSSVFGQQEIPTEDVYDINYDDALHDDRYKPFTNQNNKNNEYNEFDLLNTTNIDDYFSNSNNKVNDNRTSSEVIVNSNTVSNYSDEVVTKEVEYNKGESIADLVKPTEVIEEVNDIEVEETI